MNSDTIAAISTAPGLGAIGIIRLSGNQTFSISQSLLYQQQTQLTKEFLSSHPKKALFVDFKDPFQDSLLDKILVFTSVAPQSYTGEDMCEFHFHGNPILLRQALEILYKKGARPAEPGEFTKRAYINGKLDLSEAEAVGRLIHARSRFELELSQKNLFGEISKLSSRLRSELIGIKAECEAEIDFSTEDLTYESLEERKARIQKIVGLTNRILEKSERADNLLNRSKVVLLGEPNAGKSSLMNAILGRERSIISSVPGTTRDYITADMHINGLPIELVDTAGMRDTIDPVEKAGIERTMREAENAHIRLFLIDTSLDLDWNIFINTHYSLLEKSYILANKSDNSSDSWNRELFEKNFPSRNILSISCKTGEGIDKLVEFLEKDLAGEESSDGFVVLEDRQKYHFQKMRDAMQRAWELMVSGAPAEITIEEINEAIIEVSSILGQVTTEEVLGRIFSVFCVGK